jgi:tRNA pseudouridine55 synthase
MDGIININKDKDMSSFDIIRKLRKVLNTRKIGHTGTLDPMATGVMVVCVGGTTKLASLIEAEEKIYLAKMKLGFATDTLDITGTVTEESEKNSVSFEEFESVLGKFVGEIEQIPPMYSAIKIDGQKLYELARKGKEIERKARKVSVEYIKVHHFDGDEIIIECKVSKGTYIRTLIDDIGRELGTYATMTELQRRCVGNYHINKSYTLKDIEHLTENGVFSFLKSVEESFDFSKINIVEDEQKRLLSNGNKIRFDIEDGCYRLYFDNEFWGLGKVEEGKLKPYKYFGKL